jgi:hypothetical protein
MSTVRAAIPRHAANSESNTQGPRAKPRKIKNSRAKKHKKIARRYAMATLKRGKPVGAGAAGGAPAGMHLLETRMATFKARKWPHGKDSIRKVRYARAARCGAAVPVLTRRWRAPVCRGRLVPRRGGRLERLCQMLHVQQGPGWLGKG